MAIIEQNALLRCKDERGNEYLLYPITTIDCVDGAEDLVHFDKEQELTAEQKAQFLKNIGGLCAPQSARANQFLKVSAVDDNGNVTAVETAAVEGGNGSTVALDATLTQEGAAADAKAVGDAIASLNHITASDNGDGIITLSVSPESGGSSDGVRYVTFVNTVNGEQFVKPVAVGDDCADVVAKGLWEKPTKDCDTSGSYEYAGWSATPNGETDSEILKNITQDKVVYSTFTLFPIFVSGECGPSATWGLDTKGVVQIWGEGEISDVRQNYLDGNDTFGTYGKTHVKRAVIHEGITSIGKYYFQNCVNLETISFPNTLTAINQGVFWGCSGLKQLTVPNSVTTFGPWACFACAAMTEVTLPDNLPKLTERNFWQCYSLKHFHIPATVRDIDWFQLYQCTALESVIFPDPNGWWAAGNSTATSGEAIDPAILADPAAAAVAMSTTYGMQFLRQGERS